ncbi:MAG: hypothetical protein ACLVLG_04240 [Anaerovoracaceae bacterium]
MNFRDIIHKYRVPVILAALVLIFTAAACYLTAQVEDHGRNPIDGINENRSYIPVTGQDYSLNYEQENAYLEEEQQRAEAIEEKIQQQTDRETAQESSDAHDETGPGDEGGESPDEDGGNNTGGSTGAGEGENGENTGGDQDISRLPVIICSLTDGQTIDGAFLSFTVRATSYKNVQLGAFDISVTVNGSKIYSSGNQNGTISYRTSQSLRDGQNEVTIQATDDEGYTATKTYTVIVNSDQQQKEGGTMRVTLRADVLSLGVIFDETVVFYEGENLPYVVDRAFKQAGIVYSYSGTFDYGFYLQRIYKTGVTDGYVIPGPILDKLEEENASWVGYEKDSLGEKDFYYWSGWVYRLDGYFPDGFSAIPAEDGSEIEILFTLNNGNEYDGTWFNGDWKT